MNLNKPGVKARLKTYLLRGLIFLCPIAVAIWVLTMTVQIADSWLGPVMAPVIRLFLPSAWLGTFHDGHVPGLGLAALVLLLLLLGWVGSFTVGRQGLRLIDVVFMSIPAVRVLYSTVHKLAEAAIGEESKHNFKRAVFIKHGGVDVLTLQTGEFINKATGAKHLVVFWPHAPIMSAGLLLCPREDETVDAGLNRDQLLQIALSMGGTMPAILQVTRAICQAGSRCDVQ